MVDYVSSTTPWHAAMLHKLRRISPPETAVMVLLVPSESELESSDFDAHQRDTDIFSYMERTDLFPDLRVVTATRDGDRLSFLLQGVDPDKIHWCCRHQDQEEGVLFAPALPEIDLRGGGPPSILVYVARDDVHTLDKVLLALLKVIGSKTFRVILYYPHCRVMKLRVAVDEKERANIVRGNEMTLSYYNAKVSLRVKDDLEPDVKEVVADFTLVRPGCSPAVIEHVATMLRGARGGAKGEAREDVELITSPITEADMWRLLAKSDVFLPVGFECVPDLAITAQQLGCYCLFLEDTEAARRVCVYGEVLFRRDDLYFDETTEKVRSVVRVADIITALQRVFSHGLDDPFFSYGKEIARILFRAKHSPPPIHPPTQKKTM